MSLFDSIPSSLFSIFNSKNKDIYVGSLFLIKKVFDQELMVEKKVLVKQLADNLATKFSHFVEEENQKIEKSATSVSHLVIRKLIETGWLEIEYGMDTDFKENIAIPPYSIKIINTLHSIMEEETREYNSYMYSVYSNLQQAATDKKDFMYSAIKNAFEKTKQLEEELKTLFHNIRRKHNKLSFLNNVNDVLQDHFDEYQKKVVRQIYLPMKTKDSLNRFKGSVIKILTSWLRNSQDVENIVSQAFASGNFKNIEEAKDSIIAKMYFVVDKFYELEDMIAKIDAKNKQYIGATTEKMKFLLNKDTSSRAKMVKILERLEDNFENEELQSALQSNINLSRQGYYDDTSLFVRSIPDVHFDNEPMEIDPYFSDDIEAQTSSLAQSAQNSYSHKNVVDFISSSISEKEEMHIKELTIENEEQLILAIHSFLKGWDKNIFYKIDLQDGFCEKAKYIVPNMTYLKRRKK